MDVTCTCGTVFQARDRRARYCSDRCRKRKARGAPAEATVTSLPSSPPVDPEDAPGGVEVATAEALSDADRLDSPLGQACLVLARRLDRPGMDTGSAMAAVARQLEAMLASATRGAGGATSPQQLRDELAERRRKHGA